MGLWQPSLALFLGTYIRKEKIEKYILGSLPLYHDTLWLRFVILSYLIL